MVQNNVVRLEKHKQGRQSHARNLSLSRDLLANNEIDLLIWPESSYSLALRRPLPLDAQFIRADLEVPLLFGGTSSWHAAGRSASANTLFFANQKGQIQQAYDKQSLIPFAESLPGLGAIAAFEKSPFGSLWPTIQSDYVSYVQELFPWHQQFKPGPESSVIQVGDFRIATPICFEMVQADTVRKLVSEHAANLIVTIANDAWFGTSQEPWIHLKLSRLRAIEHGLWVVRATNSGISAIINPQGEISAQTGLFRAETLASSVQARPATTPYTRLGDWPGPAALILGCALWIRSRITQRSLQTSLPASSHN